MVGLLLLAPMSGAWAVLCGKQCGSVGSFCNEKVQWCSSSYSSVGGSSSYAYCLPMHAKIVGRAHASTDYVLCYATQAECIAQRDLSTSGPNSDAGKYNTPGYRCSAVGATATSYGMANIWQCLPGWYGNKQYVQGSSASAITCTKCPAGRYGATAGLSSSTCSGICSGFSYSTAGSTACTDCSKPANSTSIISDATTPNTSASACGWVCNDGYYGSASAGSTACTQCTGATYCSGGTQYNCPTATSGWTRGTGTGWKVAGDCYQTRNATDISSYCTAGQIKQLASSSTAWRSAITTSVAFKAKAGARVYGQDCVQCDAGTYQPTAGSTATSCTSCDKGTYASAKGATGCTACPKHTSNNGSTVNGTTSSTGSTSPTQCYLAANSGATWTDSTGHTYDCPTVTASYAN